MGAGKEPSPYVARLPIGERLPLGDLLDNELFPFEGDIRTVVLDPPILPEPARLGEPGAGPCPVCSDPLGGAIWSDDRWLVQAGERPGGLPLVLRLACHAHHDLEDLPPPLTAELGRMIQRIARALGSLDGIGRVHVNRWGDGSQHFHIWFLPRPAGMWQMRGAMLAVWDDLLPPVPQDEWEANRRTVAAALAAEGGEARV
jgi:diadenosine tetraphosphate (Ap4A) HIT family hydrolase